MHGEPEPHLYLLHYRGAPFIGSRYKNYLSWLESPVLAPMHEITTDLSSYLSPSIKTEIYYLTLDINRLVYSIRT